MHEDFFCHYYNIWFESRGATQQVTSVTTMHVIGWIVYAMTGDVYGMVYVPRDVPLLIFSPAAKADLCRLHKAL